MANRFLSNIRINDAYTFPASDGSFGQAIITDGAGNLSFGNVASGGTADTASVIYKDNFTGDGVETQFSMARGITNEDQTQIFIDGVYQQKDTYSVSGNLITFSEAPESGHSIEVMTIAGINTGPTLIYQDNFTGNGATTDFTLANSVNNEIKTLVFLNGVYQFKDTYSVSGTTLSFDTAPTNGTLIEVITIGSAAAEDYNQTLLFYGKASAAITKGQAVMFAGVEGDHFLVAPAVQATIEANHEYMLGIANQDFALNEFGYVTEFGRVSGLNTNAYTAGDIIWYDSASGTAGAVTTTEPTPPNAKIQLAAVIRSHPAEGVLFVRPTIYHGLEELENVNVTSVADRDLLVYNNSTGNWINSTLDADEIDDTSTTNKFTSQAEIDKLAGIEAGAQVNTLDGSGAANYVSKWSDADTLTNSVIYDNGTNVGIGTSSPNNKLIVNGGIGAIGEASAGLTNGILIDQTASTLSRFLSYSATSSSIAFYTGTNSSASERVRIDASGNVGIGTGSPGQKLTVQDAGDTYIQIRNNTAGQNFFIGATSTEGTIVNDNATPITFKLQGAERVRITNTGNVGIGTSSPIAKLSIPTGNTQLNIGTDQFNNAHIASGINENNQPLGINIQVGNPTTLSYSKGAAINLYGNTQAAADARGSIYFNTSSDPAAGNTIRFLTVGSERMRITNGGLVFVGKTTTALTTAGVLLVPNGRSQFIAQGNDNIPLAIGSADDITLTLVQFYGAGALAGSISMNQATSISYNTSSDYRLKENVVPMEGALERVSQLQPSRFNFIAYPETTVDGFLAHEVAEVIPEAITGEKDAVDEKGNPVYQGIDQSKLVPLLVGAIQELKAEIETLKAQINN